MQRIEHYIAKEFDKLTDDKQIDRIITFLKSNGITIQCSEESSVNLKHIDIYNKDSLNIFFQNNWKTFKHFKTNSSIFIQALIHIIDNLTSIDDLGHLINVLKYHKGTITVCDDCDDNRTEINVNYTSTSFTKFLENNILLLHHIENEKKYPVTVKHVDQLIECFKKHIDEKHINLSYEKDFTNIDSCSASLISLNTGDTIFIREKITTRHYYYLWCVVKSLFKNKLTDLSVFSAIYPAELFVIINTIKENYFYPTTYRSFFYILSSLSPALRVYVINKIYGIDSNLICTAELNLIMRRLLSGEFN